MTIKIVFKNLLIVVLLISMFSNCVKIEREYASRSLLETYSQNLIGKRRYLEIRNNLIDSITMLKEIFPYNLGARITDNVKVQPILCFSKDTTKFSTSIIAQGKGSSSISPILGFKYQNKWEFYIVSLSIYYFNDRHGYEVEDTIPMSYLLDSCTPTGYLKQNIDTREFEINQKFFDRQFRGPGWGEPHGGEPFPDSLMLENYYKHVKFRRTEMAKQKIEKHNKFLDDK